MDLPRDDRFLELLAASREGDPAARDAVFAAVYDQVKRIATRALSGLRASDTLQPTILANEALARLVPGLEVVDRAHLLSVAAVAMRQIVVDHARRRRAAKRGHGFERITLSRLPGHHGPDPDVLDVHEAVEALAALDPRQAEIVQLKFFGGLEGSEIAAVLGISASTVDREWRAARAWLALRLAGRA